MTFTGTRIGTFDIVPQRRGGFDVFDRDAFNNWGSRMGFVTLAQAERYATWAHAFKTGRTFQSLATWKG